MLCHPRLRQMGWLKAASIVGVFASAIASSAFADYVVPPGLSPGEKYRLVLLTNGFYSATSSDITTYDAQVQADAAADPNLAGLVTTWQVIGSTSSVSASNHIALGNSDDPAIYQAGSSALPSYETLIASNLASLFSTSVPPIGHTGGAEQIPAWTGTLTDGSAATGNELGSANPTFGLPSDAGSVRWNDGTSDGSGGLFLYGISGELTAPGAVPEPASLGLLAAGALLWTLRSPFGESKRQPGLIRCTQQTRQLCPGLCTQPTSAALAWCNCSCGKAALQQHQS